MARHIGGSPAESGYYWNPRRWSITPVERPGGFLPGGPEDRYLQIPTLAVLMLLPILGGLFVVFLPVIGFVLVAYALARKVAALARGGAADLASTMTPGWRPGEAHLTGTGREADKDLPHEHGAGDQALEALRKEIADKRGGDEET
ncbi:MAG TPA: hypothetical protein VFR85_03990 [Anaeromyxobacteraceae bacterium]|nr:hypothetical protein [Anaeromyxobacteraceae bacterium]